jgi:hypothetical protein
MAQRCLRLHVQFDTEKQKGTYIETEESNLDYPSFDNTIELATDGMTCCYMLQHWFADHQHWSLSLSITFFSHPI